MDRAVGSRFTLINKLKIKTSRKYRYQKTVNTSSYHVSKNFSAFNAKQKSKFIVNELTKSFLNCEHFEWIVIVMTDRPTKKYDAII